MSKNKLTNKINKENSELINKSNSNNDLSEEDNSQIENTRRSKVKDDGESEKYRKEMYEFADKNEFRTNVIFWVLGIVMISVIMFSILMSTPFMKPKTDVAKNKIATKTTVDNSSTKAPTIKPVGTANEIFEYLNVEVNRTSVLNKAVELNKGSKKGVTVYLLSEILRNNTIAIPANTSSVEGLMTNLTASGWKKNTDFTKLEKGDLCFTTDMPSKPGVPSHAYVFMGWVEEGKTDYANICDGQLEEFGDVLHKRNLSISTTAKDKFSFFLKK